MKTPKIPKTVYIASNNPTQCIALLKEHQIKVDEDDAQSIAEGLTYLIRNGKENDLSKIIALHPDREMILSDAKKFGGYNTTANLDGEALKAKIEKETKAKNVNSTNDETKKEPKANTIISPNTANILLGASITLIAIVTISYLVKH